MDARPVPVRTDASADTFWSRPRESDEYSPADFRVLPPDERIRRLTPFGRQKHPAQTSRPPSRPPLRASRSVERIELRKAIRDAEEEKENLVRAREPGLPPTDKSQSRRVERAVMRKAMAEQEDDGDARRLAQENDALRRRIAHLERNLTRALHINHALTRNMLVH